MNLLEHYIVKIHSVEDVTKEYEEHTGQPASEPLYKVDLTYNCYGSEQRTEQMFWKSDWNKAQLIGYFMG